MSASAEIPDIIGGITNTLGLNRLWETEQQQEAESWREKHEDEKDEKEERREKERKETDEGSGGVAPVSIADEKRTTDHDGDIHGTSKSWTKCQPSEKKRLDWPALASLELQQARQYLPATTKTEAETEPVAGEASGIVEKEEVDQQSAEDGNYKTTKPPFLASLRPFFGSQKLPRADFSASSAYQSFPRQREDLLLRERPGSSSGVPQVERPVPQRRQYTMPANGRTLDSPRKATARSRWQNATQNIRIPLRRKRTDRPVEQSRGGSDVLATLQAGAPAATLIATHMLPDERSHHRVSVIVDLLKIHITDSVTNTKGHAVYRIDLTYGEGPTQMKWTVHREQRDFQALHNRLRILYLRRREKLPEFPHSTFAFWLGNLGLTKDERSEAKEAIPRQLGPGIAAGIGALAAAVGGGVPDMKKKDFQMMVRIKLQEYITQLALFLRARPGLNRLCKFLELSALGIRLASENSYHGKEGWLVIASLKGSNAAIHCNPRLYKRRHTPKWFMVRHSYIVCVEDMEGMNIYDVLLVDSDFEITLNALPGVRRRIENDKRSSHHLFTIRNAERSFKLGSNGHKKMEQFIESIQMMRELTPWSKKHRFNSFAPVRHGVQAQWLVDGRDYFWNVSRAILKARDVIYIHDWWLSPELHMRRPAANAQKWRLDRLLQRKAQEGVKIYVIIYQNVGTTVPIDSTHSKYSLLGLHPNVFVQRSPRHVGGLGQQNVFFWAHHEKIISIDDTVGFVGGLDLCFGRWDTPEHVLVDDKPSGIDEGLEGKTIKDPQIWPGKDYSNPRIRDFYELDEPYEDMYDRKQVPRMPWHDVAMQFTGQPARDIARHFVQRWNYLLRTKPPSKPCPILLPPPDFKPCELEALNLTGTCEVQILRSCGQWSMGLQDKTEQSIQNAYLKCIEQSEHFVYIENQFFITSTVCDGTKIENQIGDAIVNRILRAHKEGTEWRAVIIIPLMPGFQNTIDSPDGSSLRLIMYAQYYSLCRGETSIFGRLRRANIEPEDYISVYALRGWGKIGDQDQLVTEQIYIHAKIMIVDDRVAIIGSANINERSMRGNRDSEVAAIVRDTEQYEITMAGKPFMVGKFAHTLRMRLQLEHLGVNTDDFEQRAWMMDGLARQNTPKVKSWDTEKERRPTIPVQPFSFNHDEPWRKKYMTVSRTSSDDEREIHGENEKHESWYRKFGKADSRGQSLEKKRAKTFAASSEQSPDHSPRNRSGTWPNDDDEINRHPTDLSANHSDFQQTESEIQANGHRKEQPQSDRHTPQQREPQANGSTTPSNDASEKPLDPHPHPSIHKSVDRSQIGRPKVTTSANPLAGGIPPNMSLNTTPLDRAEELEQAKRDPDTKRKSASGSSGETLADTRIVSPLLLSPLVLGSPKPHVHHGDGGSFVLKVPKISQVTEKPIPKVDPYNFIDPLDETFFFDQWHAVAEHNTAVYRRVFRPMPDNDVKTWAEYKEFFAFGERLAKAQGGEKGKMRTQQEQTGASGPVGAPASGKLFVASKADHGNRDDIKEYAEGGEDVAKDEKERIKEDLKVTKGRLKHGEEEFKDEMKLIDHEMKEDMSEVKSSMERVPSEPGTPLTPTSTRRRRAKSNPYKGGLSILPRDTMEELLGEVQGHLVIWPTDWLEKEDANGNFLYNIDKVQPMEIYD